MFEFEDDFCDSISIEKDFEVKEKKMELYSAMTMLTKRQRDVLILYYFKGKSHNEIADLLGIKARTVINTKTRAIVILREKLSDKNLIKEKGEIYVN